MKLIGVNRSAVLIAGLFIMARFAKGLPVGFVPHQSGVATMRNDMVDYRCRDISSLLQATYTHRVLAEVNFTEPTPLAVVTTLCS